MATVNPPIALTTLSQLAASRSPALEPLTLDQVEQMVKHGILTDGAPIELIDGLLIRKDRSARGDDPTTHNPAHSQCVKRLLQVLAYVQSLGFHLQCQAPIALLPTRAPEPDLAIIRGTPRDYSGRHPGPNDVAAVFEVADSSLGFDRSTKQFLYASAAIPTYWIINLVDQIVEVYENPNIAAGTFSTHMDYRIGQAIELTLRPNISQTIRVDEFLG